MKTFTIDYRVITTEGTFHPLKMRVKNCDSMLHAKFKLAGYAEQRYAGFQTIEVIDCRENIRGMEMFDDIFNGKR